LIARYEEIAGARIDENSWKGFMTVPPAGDSASHVEGLERADEDKHRCSQCYDGREDRQFLLGKHLDAKDVWLTNVANNVAPDEVWKAHCDVTSLEMPLKLRWL
jgi:hypothetical protein